MVADREDVVSVGESFVASVSCEVDLDSGRDREDPALDKYSGNEDSEYCDVRLNSDPACDE